VYRRSLVRPHLRWDRSLKIEPSPEAARKDSAVHVSLSSDSPVKQPGTAGVPSPRDRRAVEASIPDSASGLVTYISEVLRTGASSRRAAARRVWWLYRRGPRALSTAFVAVFLPSGTPANSGIFLHERNRMGRSAALEPQSSPFFKVRGNAGCSVRSEGDIRPTCMARGCPGH
jgi:hypothetical protein